MNYRIRNNRMGWHPQRSFLLLWALTIATIAAAISPQEAVDRFASTAKLPSGSMAVLVTDLRPDARHAKQGAVVASYNADLPLIPASIMKSITIASLSDRVDPASQWLTEVQLEGKVKDGVLHGNIVIVGSGDPTINSTTWPESPNLINEIVETLKREGISSVEGNVVIDESYFAGEAVPPTWAAADLSRSYGTGSHAFNYANNASGKSAVKNPAALFGAALRTALTKAGISLGQSTLNEGVRHTLFTHSSAEMRDIMRSCMNRSDNLFAETFLRRFGKELGGDGSTADAAQREMEYWTDRGADMKGVKIVDGSGLSRSNRVTARFMESVLRLKANDVEYASFFPLAGQEGTLRSFLAGTPLDSYIAMKTGSMSGIQCYAGYKLDDDFAPTHAVVVIVNNFTCDRTYLRRQIEQMLQSIFEE